MPQFFRSTRIAVLVAVIALLAGCGGAADHTPRLPVVDSASANVVLWVSNQSFDDETVRITVTIDGRAVIDQDFDVENQHNSIEFPLAADPGSHELAVTSDTGARLVELTAHDRADHPIPGRSGRNDTVGPGLRALRA